MTKETLCQVEVLRGTVGYFTTKRVKLSAGIPPSVSDENVRRVLGKNNLHYMHARKKGILSKKDTEIRLKFAHTVLRRLTPDIWTQGIGFYLDGVGFTHKYNPFDQAQAPRTMAWRKRGNVLNVNHTSKGSHEGSGGRIAHFLVVIAYGKGVLLAEQYEGQLNGEKFVDFIKANFPTVFASSRNPMGKLFLQDGDPSQNSRKAEEAMKVVGARKFKIPARSPDLNPIENVFHNVKQQLMDEALSCNITHETFTQFSAII